jgi:hypothetical protein
LENHLKTSELLGDLTWGPKLLLAQLKNGKLVRDGYRIANINVKIRRNNLKPGVMGNASIDVRSANMHVGKDKDIQRKRPVKQKV